MDDLQELFVVCMAVCFAISTFYAFASVNNLQEQIKNYNEVAEIGVSLLDSLGLFQISVQGDRMQEFKTDYINDRERYNIVGDKNYWENKELGEEFESINRKTFWWSIAGFIFFILHLRIFKKLKKVINKILKTKKEFYCL